MRGFCLFLFSFFLMVVDDIRTFDIIRYRFFSRKVISSELLSYNVLEVLIWLAILALEIAHQLFLSYTFENILTALYIVHVIFLNLAVPTDIYKCALARASLSWRKDAFY